MKTKLFITLLIGLFFISNIYAKDTAQKCSFDDIFPQYFNIWKKLANDELTGISDISKSIEKILLEKKNLPVCKNIKEMKPLLDTAVKFGHWKDIKTIREEFSVLSELLLPYAKMRRSIFIFRCSMALDGKGANWFQRDHEIKNPYFGKSMLKCGEEVAKDGKTKEDHSEHHH